MISTRRSDRACSSGWPKVAEPDEEYSATVVSNAGWLAQSEYSDRIVSPPRSRTAKVAALVCGELSPGGRPGQLDMHLSPTPASPTGFAGAGIFRHGRLPGV